MKLVNEMKKLAKDNETASKKSVNKLKDDINEKDNRIKELTDKLVGVEEINSKLIGDMHREYEKFNEK